ncbi:hypothetical protein WME94_20460 [Sorangium sp. So ce429]
MTSRSEMSATSLRRPRHGQANTSSRYTLRSRLAQSMGAPTGFVTPVPRLLRGPLGTAGALASGGARAAGRRAPRSRLPQRRTPAWSACSSEVFTSPNDNTGDDAWPFNNNFHIILNLAIGGDWGGAQGVDPNIWSRQMLVDYVRVYQK